MSRTNLFFHDRVESPSLTSCIASSTKKKHLQQQKSEEESAV